MGQRLHRNLFGALCILFCSLSAQAQLVFIPDTHLRARLAAWAPGAVDVDGNLDPQHPNVVSKSSLSIDAEMDWDPVDLTGLGALDQLDSLYVTFVWVEGQMTLASFDTVQISVPAWPPNLTKMNLLCGTYASLPAWPSNLTQLSYNLPSGPSALPPLPPSITQLTFTAGEDLISLPELPAGLQTLTLSAPPDNVVPTLPMSVTELSISGFGPPGATSWPDALVQITLTSITAWTALPTWPAGVQRITVNGADGLGALPPWPSSLASLNLTACTSITDLPPFPTGLFGLSLGNLTALTALPDYPASLEELHVGGLGVALLPEWPVIPDEISIGGMPNLVAMPDFPSATTWITISGDMPSLAAFPDWPGSLTMLDILASDMPALPDFPAGLNSLQLAGANLDCIPMLPDGLDGFLCFGCGISCLPNAPAGMVFTTWPDGQPAPLPPLCNVLNSTCDFLNPVATGSVYVDQNANGVRDGGEPGYPFATINAQPGNITYGVPSSGDFNLPLPLDQYTLTASSGNPYVLSISPASHDAPFVNASDVDAGNDFGVVLQPDMQDLRIDLNGPWGRPGFESGGVITYDNIGSTSVNGTIVFQLDAQQSWVESSPAPTSVNGNTITWEFPGLPIGGSGSISLTVYTDNAVPLGTPLQHTAIADPLANDETPGDNTAVANTEVFGSWDPNDKRVEPATLTPEEIAAGEEVIYTIRFQNTGTYQADRVIITDELSDRLQWSTMRLINSSHPCTWVLSDDGRLRFTFEPIFLPDSTTNEPSSHGYVRFAMKPVSDLMLGEEVSNTADIHFDFNGPVFTNEAIFSVETSTSVSSSGVVTPSGAEVWPNPANDVLYVKGSAGTRMDFLDVTGRVVASTRATGTLTAVDITSLRPGLYTVRAYVGDRIRSIPFTKH